MKLRRSSSDCSDARFWRCDGRAAVGRFPRPSRIRDPDRLPHTARLVGADGQRAASGADRWVPTSARNVSTDQLLARGHAGYSTSTPCRHADLGGDYPDRTDRLPGDYWFGSAIAAGDRHAWNDNKGQCRSTIASSAAVEGLHDRRTCHTVLSFPRRRLYGNNDRARVQVG